MFLWNAGWMLQTQTWTTPVGDPIKVALIQANTAQDMKFMIEAADPIMQGYYNMSQVHQDADLIIWPETAIPIMFHESIPFLQKLLVEAKTHDTQFLIGVPIQSPEDNLYYNTVMQLSKKPVFYHKRHLVPFGEYLPGRQLIEYLLPDLYIPMSDFNAGKKQQNNIKIGDTILGVSICYEAIFPEEIRRALPDAGILINVSNDGWFGDSIAAQQHLQMARMRALENGRPLLRATNTGLTVVIDPKGQVIEQIPQFKTAALRAEVRAYEGSTPYQKTGEKWILVLIVVSLLIGFVGRMED
jgi:apolipoprotein N-acyltransferase